MMTNWMVNYRPDIYVRWWHPRNKTFPLESEILWHGNITLDDSSIYEPTKRIQYKANADFTFKTWVFPGLNNLNDNDNIPPELIHYLYISSQDNNTIYSAFDTDAIPYPDITSYPVIGDNINRDLATGIYAVETLTDFNIAKDNLDNLDAESLLLAGDLPSDYINNMFPSFNIFQDYLNMDNLVNEQYKFKYCYFFNGRPSTDLVDHKYPSGDLLFQYFVGSGNKYLDYDASLTFNNNIISAEFGTAYSDNLDIEYEYDIDKRELVIQSELNTDDNFRYNINIISKINKTGISETIDFLNTINDYPIRLSRSVKIDADFNLINQPTLELTNINLWNSNNDSEIKFLVEVDSHRKLLNTLKQYITLFWDSLYIEEFKTTYVLKTENSEFIKIIRDLNLVRDIYCLNIKQEQTIDDKTYTLLVNDYLYIVLETSQIDDEYIDKIYDWGVVDHVRFVNNHNPIFNIELPQGNLVYGLSVNYSMGFH